jgi:SAM-dependent methyltransferase
MKPGEHEVMARAEESHWWYRGLRDLLARCLRQPDIAPPPHPRVLDAGCGTGANLSFLRELLRPSYLGGFDSSEEAVAIARGKTPEAEIRVGDICRPPLDLDRVDLLLSLDVIYIPGADRAMEGLQALVERLRPGGLFILNVPAYQWLYSEHDVAVGTSERFTARRIGALLRVLGLSVERLTYRLCFLFPLVVMSRLPGILRAHREIEAPRSDLHRVPGKLSGAVLYRILQLENRLIARGFPFPWGSSVFAIGRRR